MNSRPIGQDPQSRLLWDISKQLERLQQIVSIYKGEGGAITIADGDFVTLGSKTDAKSAATDSTAITLMQVAKEISYVTQNVNTALTNATQKTQLTGADGTVAKVSAANVSRSATDPVQLVQILGPDGTVGGGITSFGSVGNLPAALNSVVEIDNSLGFCTIGVRVIAPTGGLVTFEGTFDGINWDDFTLRSTTNDRFTTTTDDHSDFIGSISGFRKIRFRTSIAGSAAGTIMGTMNKNVSTLESIEFGYPPHRIGFAPIHKDASFSTQQTATALWTPATGKKFVITDCLITSSGTTDGEIKIFDNTDASGNYLYKGTLSVSKQGTTLINVPLRITFVSAAANNVLKITTSAAIAVDIILHGYEIS